LYCMHVPYVASVFFAIQKFQSIIDMVNSESLPPIIQHPQESMVDVGHETRGWGSHAGNLVVWMLPS
jgi:hypothetical protein